jgi:hypothetical protein
MLCVAKKRGQFAGWLASDGEVGGVAMNTKGDKVDSRRRAARKATAGKVLTGRRLALAAGFHRKSSDFANETRRATQRVRPCSCSAPLRPKCD